MQSLEQESEDEPAWIAVVRHIPSCVAVAGKPAAASQFAVIYIDGGSGSCVINGTTIDLESCDLLWIPPGYVWEPIGLADAKYWRVSFGSEAVAGAVSGAVTTDRVLERLFAGEVLSASAQTDCIRRKFRVTPADAVLWALRMERLQRELEQSRLGAAAAASAVLQLLLIDVARMAQQSLGALPAQRSPIVEAAGAFIEKKFTAPIGLADVARAVGRSPSYLTDLFRRETGQTVLQWIIARRMKEACSLLMSTDLSIKAVCTSIGYDDPGYFIRQFRRAKGTTPQCWRQHQREPRVSQDLRALPPGVCHAPAEFINAVAGPINGSEGFTSPLIGRINGVDGQSMGQAM